MDPREALRLLDGKVGLGKQSLAVTVGNFLKPWFFIYMRHGRVDGFRFASKFVD